jgi:uncharacterized protein (DUF736 family)
MLVLPRQTCPKPIHRLVPSRYPPVSLFEFARDQAELLAMAELEGYTNDRLRQECGVLPLVPEHQARCGPGYTPIMAAFTHIGFPSRFTDGQYGVYYGALERRVALDEVSYQRARFMAASQERATDIAMREYITTPRPEVEFGVITQKSQPECLDPDTRHYGPAQALGARWREQGEYGIRYPSVRSNAGECLAVLRPDALGPATQGGHFTLIWDGERITHRFEYREV